MGRDLIPPPSPAGVPTTPGGVPNLIELPPEPPRSGAEQPMQAAENPGPSAFRNRFGFILGSLAGVCVAATLVLVAVVVSSTGDPASEAGLAKNWSKWHPSDTSMEGGSAQIADKVGKEHKHPNGKQLLLVEPNPIDHLNVALRSGGSISVLNGKGVVYQLNGLGPSGSIMGGTPSPERLQVVQREALALSLYTFRYLPDVEMVVTLLPPPPPDATDSATSAACTLNPTAAECPKQTALFYRPGDLRQQLQVPLGVTVPAKAPTADTLNAAEGKTIDSLTLSNMFIWSLQQDHGLLVLDRP